MSQVGKQAVPNDAPREQQRAYPAFDRWLAASALALVSLGLVMVASASVGVSERAFGEPLHYFWRQAFAVFVGISGAAVITMIPLYYWERASSVLLLLALALLILVIVPGVGYEVNGSMRWFRFGSVSLQASEPAKLCVIVYVAAYLVRHSEQVRTAFVGFIKPIGVLTVISGLLLLEPDYGATVVMFVTCLGMLFLAGVGIIRFTMWGLVACAALLAMVILAPYRMERLMVFMDPWADPYNAGFQLTQALIAFGRGEWFGVGLGASVQKLFYLPEVHTDFIFAVIGEELGLIGSVSVIILFAFIVFRALQIGANAENQERYFEAYLAYGLGFLIGIQAFVNIGVNMGVLPTKGLTLPLVSYGSNSIIISCFIVGVLLRIGLETDYRPRPSVKSSRLV